jgi:hypothetical protein
LLVGATPNLAELPVIVAFPPFFHCKVACRQRFTSGLPPHAEFAPNLQDLRNGLPLDNSYKIRIAFSRALVPDLEKLSVLSVRNRIEEKG